VLAAHQVAQPPEDQRAERPHREAGREGGQSEDEAGDLIDAGKKLRADDGGQQAVQIEVIPLEHGTERRGAYHQPFALHCMSLRGQSVCRGRTSHGTPYLKFLVISR
jgi:hypothetical protein